MGGLLLLKLSQEFFQGKRWGKIEPVRTEVDARKHYLMVASLFYPPFPPGKTPEKTGGEGAPPPDSPQLNRADGLFRRVGPLPANLEEGLSPSPYPHPERRGRDFKKDEQKLQSIFSL